MESQITKNLLTNLYIGFEPKTDIQRGDWVINSENERFYIKDTITDYFMKEPSQLKAFYLTENEYLHSTPSGSNIFHIENAYGSVIGTQSHVVLNYNDTIQNAKQQYLPPLLLTKKIYRKLSLFWK